MNALFEKQNLFHLPFYDFEIEALSEVDLLNFIINNFPKPKYLLYRIGPV
jgi:hypothetical protein